MQSWFFSVIFMVVFSIRGFRSFQSPAFFEVTLTKSMIRADCGYCNGGGKRIDSSITHQNTRFQKATSRMRKITKAKFCLFSSSTASKEKTVVDLKWCEFSTINDGEEVVYEKAPVLLLHGLLGNKRNFATVGNLLSYELEAKRRIFGIDLRNHGDNHHDWRDEMGYVAMAKDVLHFMDNHSISKPVIVGHSMGGKVAQTIALLEPHRVEGLVVIDIAPVRYCETKDNQWRTVKEIIQFLNSVSFAEGVSRKDADSILKPGIPDPALRSFCLTNLDMRRGIWKINIEAIVAEFDELADFGKDLHHDDDNNVSEYTGDTFFIHGGQSKFVRHSHINKIAEYFPNHMITTIRGVGHWVHAEAPDDTVALLKKFLDR